MLGVCTLLSMTHLTLCHTGDTGEGVEIFPKCGLETMPQGCRRWEEGTLDWEKPWRGVLEEGTAAIRRVCKSVHLETFPKSVVNSLIERRPFVWQCNHSQTAMNGLKFVKYSDSMSFREYCFANHKLPRIRDEL